MQTGKCIHNNRPLNTNAHQGFLSLVEVIMASALSIIVMIFVTWFLISVYNSYAFGFEQTELLRRGQTTLRTIEGQMRSLTSIETANQRDITFYAYQHSGALAPDKFRYFVQGTDLKQGIIVAEGTSPNFTYPPENEKLKTIGTYLKNNNNQIFYYYDENGSLINFPISVNSVKLIRIHLELEHPNSVREGTQTVETRFQLRNKKTNL